MISSKTSPQVLIALTFCLLLLLVESRILISECPRGTSSCSHGTCVQKAAKDEKGRWVREKKCICEENYYGAACDVYMLADFSHPEVRQPPQIQTLGLVDAPMGPPDPLNEEHTYAGSL